MQPSDSQRPRECPECRHVGVERLCPHDGMATLLQGAARSDADRVKPGSVVAERYQISGVLGRGGFGAVFKARHAGTGQDVALKVLSGGEADDQLALKRFFHEARVTAGLKHPSTIRVFDFGQDDDGTVFLAMELLVGEPLANQLRARVAQGRAYSEREACEIGVAVLRSLGEAHAAGLVHRDLKPDNIFLHRVGDDDTPMPKVLDFGIAKMSGMSMTGGEQVLGTPAYMSPEQVRGQRLDGRSDLYSLGIVLYQLVAGHLPFKGETPVSTIYMHLEAAVPDLRHLAGQALSEGFIAVVERALAKRPDERYASAKEMREALQACTHHAVTGSAMPATAGEWEATQASPSAPIRSRSGSSPASGRSATGTVPTHPVPTAPVPTGPVPTSRALQGPGPKGPPAESPLPGGPAPSGPLRRASASPGGLVIGLLVAGSLTAVAAGAMVAWWWLAGRGAVTAEARASGGARPAVELPGGPLGAVAVPSAAIALAAMPSATAPEHRAGQEPEPAHPAPATVGRSRPGAAPKPGTAPKAAAGSKAAAAARAAFDERLGDRLPDPPAVGLRAEKPTPPSPRVAPPPAALPAPSKGTRAPPAPPVASGAPPEPDAAPAQARKKKSKPSWAGGDDEDRPAWMGGDDDDDP